jgi:hypothetical protein
MNEAHADAILFEVMTPLGFRVRVTEAAWTRVIMMKHPVMQGRLDAVQRILQHPEEIRRSRRDVAVYLFYRLERLGRWLCVVVKRLNGDGFLITTYPTDAIKEGEQVWPR